MSSYLVESTLSAADTGPRLDLATALAATPMGLVDHPQFFAGFVDRPDVFAAGLLAVADVAAARYADAGLAARLSSLDPVVTGSGDRLRFESFSACNGVYAHFDLLAGGLGGNRAGFGTTNIDVNQPLRTALATVGRHEAMHVSVGRDELRTSTLAETHVERKVQLPDRWVRGFAEVPAISRSMHSVGRLVGPQVSQFLGSLPRVTPPGPTLYLLPRRPRWLAAQHPIPGAARLAGASRLRGVDRLIRLVTSLEVFAAPSGASAWAFDLPAARFTLTLSPEPLRGFSGEGTLLDLLAHPQAEQFGTELLALVGWDSSIDPDQLARDSGRSDEQVTAGLAWLAASGRLGYDLTEHSWYHRELPIDPLKVLSRNPRLVSAQRLVERHAVAPTGDGWLVHGTNGHYRVSSELRCECPWEDKHHGSRGPCKHILAVTLSRQQTDSARIDASAQPKATSLPAASTASIR